MGNSFFFILFILSCILCPNLLIGQQKFERESRLKSELVPGRAQQFLDSIQTKRKVKWYLEEGLERTSIEAKFKQDRQKFSIEFDSSGIFEDVEIEVKKESIPEKTLSLIHQNLNSACPKFKIQKVQIQYSGDSSSVLSTLINGSRASACVVKYEVVVKCIAGSNSSLLEYLFSEFGELLTVSQIVFKNSSHLEY